MLNTPTTSRPHHPGSCQSFSSSLLDAICSSLDESSSPPSKRIPMHDPCRITPTSSVILTRSNSLRLSSSNKRRPSNISTIDSKCRTISQVLSSSSSSPTSPTSPGAKIAAFINSLFNTSSRYKIHKNSPSCSCCLSKPRPKCKANESNDHRAKYDIGGDSGRMMEEEKEKIRARIERRRIIMEEVMKRIEKEHDESEDDLFELELCKNDSKFSQIRDELPVYETTDPRINSAIAKKCVVW